MKDKFICHVNDSVDVLKWEELIRNSNYPTPFQKPQFYYLCKSTAGHNGLVCAIEEAGKYAAICVADIIKEKGIKSHFSRRAIIYGGPVLSDDNQADVLAILLENINNELKDKVIYVEIRNFGDYSGYSPVFTQMGWKYVPWLNVRKTLNFQNLNELISSFKYNRRREILLTLKAGFTYRESESEQEAKVVYGILKNLYKNRTGLPLPPFRYFTDFMKTGLMKLFIVMDKDVIAGGSFCVIMEKKSVFTFYYCGLRNYKPKSYPTHLAVLAAMEYGLMNGLKYLDFMGAGTPGTEYGVRNYKMEFGGDLIEEGRYLKIENKFLYPLGVHVINFLKRRKINLIR
jgi:serine/alanine adding enzyme